MQTCQIEIGSWFEPSTFIHIAADINVNLSYVPVLYDFIENPVWTVLSTRVSIETADTRFLGFYNSTDYFLTLVLQRKPAYYIYNIVIPSVVLNMITLATFFVSFELQASLSKSKHLNI